MNKLVNFFKKYNPFSKKVSPVREQIPKEVLMELSEMFHNSKMMEEKKPKNSHINENFETKKVSGKKKDLKNRFKSLQPRMIILPIR